MPRNVSKTRNLVVCSDGTGNEFGAKLSNVLKLYRVAEKNDDQLVYYDPGIGTLSMPSAWRRLQQRARGVFGMMTGWGLDQNVLDAYGFLCRNYRPGDNIYLFGFSRGAYTVRVIAGLIQLVGLLRPHQVNFAGYALTAYKNASEASDFEIAWSFRRTVNGLHVPIRFMGVWDTVSSVIVPGRTPLSKLKLEELPYTTHNPSVQTFRHAIAIDEFRRMFRVKRWDEPQDFIPNPFAKVAKTPAQDIKQVWFAGCHSDVGGGFSEDESALSKFSLLWMLAQAKANGFRTNTAMINHIVKGQIRKNARRYTPPDAAGPIHKSLAKFWWLLEWAPKSQKYRDWPERKTFAGRYIPWGEPRLIPDDAFIHHSVIDRWDAVSTYRPKNMPVKYQIER